MRAFAVDALGQPGSIQAFQLIVQDTHVGKLVVKI